MEASPPISVRSGRVHTLLREVGRRMSRWIRQRPVSLAIAAITLVCAVVTGSLLHGPAPALRASVALDVDGLLVHGRIGALLTSVLLAGDLAELLLVLAALVIVVGGAERVMGHGRTALAWGTGAVAGGLAGTALQAAGLLARGFWTTPPSTMLVLHPETPVLGVLFAASAFTGPLWRRRIRLVGGAALLVLLLYSGQPEDLDHIMGALAGFVLGAILTRARPTPVFPRSSHQEARGLLAALIAVAAIGPIVAVLQPTGYGLLRPLGLLFRDPLPVADRVHERCAVAAPALDCGRAALLAQLNTPGTVLLAVLPLVVLLVAALAVLRGRRFGAWLAAGTNGLLALLAALYYGVVPATGGQDTMRDLRDAITAQSALAVIVPLAVAGAAFAWRRHCPVLPTRRALRTGAAVVGLAVVVAGALYVGGGLLVRDQFLPRATILTLLSELPDRFVPVGFLRFTRLDAVPAGPMAALLTGWAGTGAWLVLLGTSIGVAASSTVERSGRERARLRALLRTGGAGSLSWMTTWPGNRTWFSADGRHAVAYREGSGVALTVGPPVGERDGAADAARAFAIHCGDLGLVPAFYAIPPDLAAGLGGAGAPWSTIEVGEDAVIDPAGFSMRGKHWQDVRSSVNRADRAGIRQVWTEWSALPLGQRTQIEAISEEWVADKRLPELGFTLGGPEELVDREVRLMLAVGPDDRIEAVTSWLPTWEGGEVVGLTLDFMRRRGGSMNGVMEFLIAGVITVAQQRGLRFVSLSVAPLAGAGEGEADRVQRVLAAVARVLEPAYGFRSLAAFKEKFRPELRPQLLAFPDAVALPAIGLAVARAYLPDPSLPALGLAIAALRTDDGAAGRPARRSTTARSGRSAG